MFKLNVTINPDAFKKQATMQSSLLIQHLKDKLDKTFEIVVANINYNIRYEISDIGNIQLFVLSEQRDDISLIEPTLNLNIGAWLLPESLSLDTVGDSEIKGFNPEVDNELVKYLGDHDISITILNKIYAQILSKGFINLINL